MGLEVLACPEPNAMHIESTPGHTSRMFVSAGGITPGVVAVDLSSGLSSAQLDVQEYLCTAEAPAAGSASASLLDLESTSVAPSIYMSMQGSFSSSFPFSHSPPPSFPSRPLGLLSPWHLSARLGFLTRSANQGILFTSTISDHPPRDRHWSLHSLRETVFPNV